jgi:hypothetical protein
LLIVRVINWVSFHLGSKEQRVPSSDRRSPSPPVLIRSTTAGRELRTRNRNNRLGTTLLRKPKEKTRETPRPNYRRMSPRRHQSVNASAARLANLVEVICARARSLDEQVRVHRAVRRKRKVGVALRETNILANDTSRVRPKPRVETLPERVPQVRVEVLISTPAEAVGALRGRSSDPAVAK